MEGVLINCTPREAVVVLGAIVALGGTSGSGGMVVEVVVVGRMEGLQANTATHTALFDSLIFLGPLPVASGATPS